MKSKFWAFLLSLIPGAGHMYLGMMRRGVQLMALFMLPIMIAGFLRLEVFLFTLPIIWFYSFFDSMNRLGTPENRVDEDIPVIKWIFESKNIPHNKSKLIGYGLIFVGGYLLFDRFFSTSIYYYRFPWHIRQNIQASIFAILFILGGVKLLKGSKVKVEEDKECDSGE